MNFSFNRNLNQIILLIIIIYDMYNFFFIIELIQHGSIRFNQQDW